MKYKIGTKFGNYTIKEYLLGTRGRRVYMLVCNCGHISIVGGTEVKRMEEYVSDEKFVGCKSCKFNHNKTSRKQTGQLYNSIYYRYKKAAKNRGLIFSLTIKEASELFSYPQCTYCGKGSTTKKIESIYTAYDYMGIDRLDSSKGYIKGNCVPCCSKCNVAKHVMTSKEFLSHINDIYVCNLQRLEHKLVDSSESKWGALLNADIKRLDGEDIV